MQRRKRIMICIIVIFTIVTGLTWGSDRYGDIWRGAVEIAGYNSSWIPSGIMIEEESYDEKGDLDEVLVYERSLDSQGRASVNSVIRNGRTLGGRAGRKLPDYFTGIEEVDPDNPFDPRVQDSITLVTGNRSSDGSENHYWMIEYRFEYGGITWKGVAWVDAVSLCPEKIRYEAVEETILDDLAIEKSISEVESSSDPESWYPLISRSTMTYRYDIRQGVSYRGRLEFLTEYSDCRLFDYR